jgi:hypothetical protein
MPTPLFTLPDLINRLQSCTPIIQYSSVGLLYAATGLSVGLYEVPGVGMTYWDGEHFNPYLPRGGNTSYYDDGFALDRTGPYIVDTYATHLVGNHDPLFNNNSDSPLDMDVGTSPWTAL